MQTPLSPLVHLDKDSEGGTSIGGLLSGLADKYGKTEAQILLKWNLQNDWALITTSRNADRIEQSVGLFDFELSADEVGQLRAAGAAAPLRKYWTKEMALPTTSRI